jgi:hypothetical protein
MERAVQTIRARLDVGAYDEIRASFFEDASSSAIRGGPNSCRTEHITLDWRISELERLPQEIVALFEIPQLAATKLRQSLALQFGLAAKANTYFDRLSFYDNMVYECGATSKVGVVYFGAEKRGAVLDMTFAFSEMSIECYPGWCFNKSWYEKNKGKLLGFLGEEVLQLIEGDGKKNVRNSVCL